MTTSVRRAGHSNWIIGGIAALAIVSMMLFGVVELQRINDNSNTSSRISDQQDTIAAQQHRLDVAQKQERKDVECIAAYNSAMSTRNAITTSLFKVRNIAQHHIVSAQLHYASARKLARLRKVFLIADNRYQRRLNLAPLKFTCADHQAAKMPKSKLPHLPPVKPHRAPGTSPAPSTRRSGGGSTAIPKGHGRARHHRRAHRHRHPHR